MSEPMSENSADNARYAMEIGKYLGEKFGEKIRDKIVEKIAKKMGYATAGQFLTGSFPAATLAKFGTGWMKAMKFEGDLVTYGARQGTPYDPKTNEDAYVEYLLYSWARLGKPGYKFESIGDYFPNK